MPINACFQIRRLYEHYLVSTFAFECSYRSLSVLPGGIHRSVLYGVLVEQTPGKHQPAAVEWDAHCQRQEAQFRIQKASKWGQFSVVATVFFSRDSCIIFRVLWKQTC